MTHKTPTKEADLRVFKSLPEKKSLGRYVYENLREAIVKGDLAPGSRVVESRVADALGISRTPVREAIHKLEREGLLRPLPSGGLFVAGLTRREIEETFGIRSVLESYAARLAAIHYKEEELEPLEEKIREYQSFLDRGRLDALPRINTAFHDLLYALSRSPRLVGMINGLRDQIYRFREVILKREEMAKTSNEDHRLMLALIRKRDVDGVERVVREHILRGQEVVLRDLDMKHHNHEERARRCPGEK
jgi:DNA-binding GntR family transcriptional regulator